MKVPSVFAAVLTAGLVLVAAPASAEVVTRDPDGFTLKFSTDLQASQADLNGAVRDLPKWWDPAHTYTGDAASLSMALEPGGCWCEALADGTRFEHGRVVSIAPDRIVLRAPLGPLHAMATGAALTFSVERDGAGTRLVMDYVVEGPGVGAMADPVDGVMDGAFSRLVHHIETGLPQP
jgi:CBS domain-containing protein